MAGVDSYTKLLLHCNGTDGSQTFTDSSLSPHTVLASGNTQIDTAQYVFGGASGLWDGVSDYLYSVDSDDWSFGSGDFTIDLRARFATVGNTQWIMAHWSTSSDREWQVYWVTGSNTLNFRYSTNGVNNITASFAWTPSVNTWYHIAIVRNGADLKAYINGTQIGSTYNISTHTLNNSGQRLVIGQDGNDLAWYNGWQDEIRISKGIARWTSDFTPSTEEYSLYDTTIADIDQDVRYNTTEDVKDIKQDVRYRNAIEVYGDINEDIRFTDEVINYRDINQDVRTHKETFGNIKQDVRFALIVVCYGDMKEDVRFRNLGIKDINQDIRFYKYNFSDLKQDFRYFFVTIADLNEDIRFDKVYYKDLYCNTSVEKEGEINFYAEIDEVVQPAPDVPTSLLATDMKKGDLIKLTWDGDSNYGYNIYQTDPSPRAKLNTYLIPAGSTEYLVGNLITDQEYEFVIVGVNGVGTESSDSMPDSATPTLPDFSGNASRFQTYTVETKINNVTRTDIKVDTVELGYGSSPAVARFTIPKDPETAGLPTHDDEVEVIINSKSLFKGVIKNIEKSVSLSGMACTYIAYSKLITQTYESVPWSYVLDMRKLYNLDVADQTYLQAKETVANFKGNYRLYYNMDTDEIEEYQLGTGYWNRTIFIGKNVLEWNITEDTVNQVTQLDVRGARKKTTKSWQDLSWTKRIIASGSGWEQYTLFAEIEAFNIGDIQVEAYQSVGQPEIDFDPELSVVPTDFNLQYWYNNTIEPKQVVTSYRNPANEWRGAGVSIEYVYQRIGNEDIPVKAILQLTSSPKIYQAHIVPYFGGIRHGRIPAEDISIGDVMVAFDTFAFSSPCRVSYSYEEEDPTTVSKGSGTPSRTVTDTQYKPFDDQLNGEDDTTYVLSKMSDRGYGELAKVNRPAVSGRIQILGDENFDLKTLVDINGELLDVIRVTHNFSRGFVTDIELTNERFRVNIPPYQEQRRTVTYERNITGTQSWLLYYARKLQQAKDTHYTDQEKVKDIPKSPFAVYGD